MKNYVQKWIRIISRWRRATDKAEQRWDWGKLRLKAMLGLRHK